MAAECCGLRPRRSKRWSVAALAALLPSGLVLLAIPKCPLCLWAYLGVATASFAGVFEAVMALVAR